MNEPDVTVLLQDVARYYGPIRAVDGISLQLHAGEMFGLIGHNGAGKSTLFRMMLGLVPPSRGTIEIAGAAVGTPAFRAARRRIGYLPENLSLYDNLGGLETLRFFARLKGASPDDGPALLDRLGLAHAAQRPVREYSLGMRQRLGLAQALLGNPRVLFLDEPGNGLDPAALHDMHTLLRERQQAGVTIVITSHILSELQERVDRLALLRHGKVQALGTVEALRGRHPLPLRLRVRIVPGTLRLIERRLEALPEVAMHGAGPTFGLVCPPETCMTLVRLLADCLDDLRIDEPTLEDVFFGTEAPHGMD
ncbi:ABC transporter ATP-binding protein [Cupriavidus agavae]|uniref:Cu-processing system ATP-binding protein n=1 Tax=Cupriavidus agavae TaxID=1001822 RepID=A0A4Q7S6Z8_9BURK|nr:ABC transporter ATP-binding protein [Cupriavidus agavae]RZT41488.1 Cu-processing system ATP-binding protein [Cupriavidus agavae]